MELGFSNSSAAFPGQCFPEGMAQLIRAAGRLPAAADTLQPGNGVLGLHPLDQAGDPLEVAKTGMPENVFPVSMIPWTSFEGFNLNLQKGYDYLLPVFTILRWESFTRKTDADFFPCLCRCTMPFVTVSIFAGFLGSYRN